MVNAILDTTVVPLTENENFGIAPHPRRGALVDGLALPAIRAEMTPALGIAPTSLADLDLYTEQGRHITFNYTGGQLTTISIAHVPNGER